MAARLPRWLTRVNAELDKIAAGPQAGDPAVAARLALMRRRAALREKEHIAAAKARARRDHDDEGDVHVSIYRPR